MLKKNFLTITSAIVVSFTCVFAKYECDAGCSLDASIMGPPVCGDDSFTYANECIAYCQGVKWYTSGSCSGEGDRFEVPDLVGEAAVIPLTVMKRFAQESFKFVNQETKFSTAPMIAEGSGEEEEDDDATETTWSDNVVRITSEGYKFITKASTFLDVKSKPTQPYRGLYDDRSSNLRQRDLGVIGADTRSAIANTLAFPYRTIGSADYALYQNLCTVTMISRTSALTAAHCAFNYNTQQLEKMVRVAPGRYFNATENDSTTEPFGFFDVDYMTVFPRYMESGRRTGDLAVVTYKSRLGTDPKCLNNPNVYPGDVVGYLGIDRVAGTISTVNDARLLTMTLTGYPADWSSKGAMVTSGLCSSPPQTYGPGYINHVCDTAPGMSGSAVLTDKNIVLGVHNLALTSVNGASVFNSTLFDFVYAAAGLASQTPLDCQTAASICPCSQYASNRLRRIRCWIRNYSVCLASLQN